MMPLSLIYAVLTAFILCVVFAWALKHLANRLGLVVEPGAHRQHLRPTPVVGGIAIISATAIAAALWDPNVLTPFTAVSILLLIGVIDDRVHLSSWLRLFVQCAAVYVLMLTTGVALVSLGDLFGRGVVMLNEWSVAMTLFACIGVINAVNMSDGIDGLAGCLVLIACIALMVVGGPSLTLTALLIAAVLGFLMWNMRIGRESAALFMGDAGSTTLGLLLAYLLIEASQGVHATIAPVTALWFLALPLIDAVAVLIIRPIRGRSPFSADHLHYHHALRELGLSVNQTVATAAALQALLAMAGLGMHTLRISESIQLSLFLTLFLAYVVFMYRRSAQKTIFHTDS